MLRTAGSAIKSGSQVVSSLSNTAATLVRSGSQAVATSLGAAGHLARNTAETLSGTANVLAGAKAGLVSGLLGGIGNIAHGPSVIVKPTVSTYSTLSPSYGVPIGSYSNQGLNFNPVDAVRNSRALDKDASEFPAESIEPQSSDDTTANVIVGVKNGIVNGLLQGLAASARASRSPAQDPDDLPPTTPILAVSTPAPDDK